MLHIFRSHLDLHLPPFEHVIRLEGAFVLVNVVNAGQLLPGLLFVAAEHGLLLAEVLLFHSLMLEAG